MTPESLKAAIAAHRFPFRPVWIGHLTEGGELTAIVEETELRRLYKWPECTAWRKPLPGGANETTRPPDETKPPKRETRQQQLSLF